MRWTRPLATALLSASLLSGCGSGEVAPTTAANPEGSSGPPAGMPGGGGLPAMRPPSEGAAPGGAAGAAPGGAAPSGAPPLGQAGAAAGGAPPLGQAGASAGGAPPLGQAGAAAGGGAPPLGQAGAAAGGGATPPPPAADLGGGAPAGAPSGAPGGAPGGPGGFSGPPGGAGGPGGFSGPPGGAGGPGGFSGPPGGGGGPGGFSGPPGGGGGPGGAGGRPGFSGPPGGGGPGGRPGFSGPPGGGGFPGANPAAAGASGAGASADLGGGPPAGAPSAPGAGGSESAANGAPKTIVDWAHVVMQMGRESDAFNLLYAHALVDDHGPTETLEKMRWVNSMRRPALGVRWGLGIVYSGTRNVDGPEPIGGSGGGGGFGGGGPGAMPGAPGGGRGGRRGGPSGPGGPAGADLGGGGGKPQKKDPFKAPDGPREQLSFYTGTWSTKVLEEMKTRLSNGAFGDFLKDAQARHREPAGGGGFSGGFAGPGGPPSGAPGLAGIGAGGGPGGFSGPPVGGAGPGGFQGFSGGSNAAAGNPRQLLAGVTMIGTDDKLTSLLEKAHREGVDFLIVFDIDVALSSGKGGVQNTTKLELHEVNTRKRLGQSSSLLNIRSEKEIEEGKDPVGREVSKFFAIIDEKIQMGDLPDSATPDKVETLIDTKLAEKQANPIPLLAELKYFYNKNLLSGDKFFSGCTTLVGEKQAKMVAEATEEQLLAALASYLPKEIAAAKK